MSRYDRARDRDTWEKIFRDADPAWLLAPPSPLMQRVADFFQTAGASRILDAGSGFGRWAVFLAERLGSDLVGLDYAIGGARMAHHLSSARDVLPSFLVGEMTTLPFKDGRFDGILAVLVLDNLGREEAKASMRELMRVALSGASLFAVFNPRQRPEGDGENPTASCHSEDYTRDQVLKLLEPWTIEAESVDEHGLRAFEATLRHR